MKISFEMECAALAAYVKGGQDGVAMRAALAAVIPLVLEDAAKICEGIADGQDEAGYCSAMYCADLIRDLKELEAKGEAPEVV